MDNIRTLEQINSISLNIVSFYSLFLTSSKSEVFVGRFLLFAFSTGSWTWYFISSCVWLSLCASHFTWKLICSNNLRPRIKLSFFRERVCVCFDQDLGALLVWGNFISRLQFFMDNINTGCKPARFMCDSSLSCKYYYLEPWLSLWWEFPTVFLTFYVSGLWFLSPLTHKPFNMEVQIR